MSFNDWQVHSMVNVISNIDIPVCGRQLVEQNEQVWHLEVRVTNLEVLNCWFELYPIILCEIELDTGYWVRIIETYHVGCYISPAIVNVHHWEHAVYSTEQSE